MSKINKVKCQLSKINKVNCQMSKINKVNFDGAYLRSSSGHFFLSFADKQTFVENISHTGPRENTFFGVEIRKKEMQVRKTILSNFCSAATILIFVRLPTNHNFSPVFLGAKSRFAAKQTKMSIAAPEQKLLRIVFPTYMSFFGSQIQKKYFPGGRCVKSFLERHHHTDVPNPVPNPLKK